MLIALLLVAVTLAVYWRLTTHEFINYDDTLYVTENPRVQAGLTYESIHWAFSSLASDQRTYYHPLTWLSHMLDCQVFGLRPGWHHLVNLCFHIANTLLLFFLFKRMTGAVARSAVLAALFALHPLQVDTVAWVAERKNVLSTLFWLLTLLAYVHYARRPGLLRYVTVGVLFALGLLAKPMLVTLPCALLLLDFWPLRRVRSERWPALKSVMAGPFALASPARLVVEKLPLFALAAVAAAITILAHSRLGLLLSTTQLPLGSRLLLSLVSYAAYLEKTLWPAGLAVYYPLAVSWPWRQIVWAAVLLAAVSLLALRNCRRLPYLLVGWLWFLGTLIPVIGLLQVSDQAMADRWAYVPLIGLFLMAVWGGADLLSAWRLGPVVRGTAACVVVAAFTVVTMVQLRHWQNSETLFRHALAVTRNNHLAHLNLGAALAAESKLAEAGAEFDEALRIKPDSAVAHFNRGSVFGLQGRLEDARLHYVAALQAKPDYAQAQFNLGNVLALQRKHEEAKTHFLEALRIKPDYADANTHLGNLLMIQGKPAEATGYFRAALRAKPNSADVYCHLADALAQQGKTDEAKASFFAALRCNPDYAEAHARLGNLLLRQGDVNEALPHLQSAAELEPTNSDYSYCFGGVLARQRRFAEAATAFRASVKANPDFASALNDLAWLLAARPEPMIRNVPEAVRLAQRACDLTHDENPMYLDTLAMAQSEAGKLTEAARLTEKAVSLASAAGDAALAAQLGRRLELYRAGRSYTQSSTQIAPSPR